MVAEGTVHSALLTMDPRDFCSIKPGGATGRLFFGLMALPILSLSTWDNIYIAPNQVNRQTMYLLTKHQNIYLIHATNATYFSDL